VIKAKAPATNQAASALARLSAAQSEEFEPNRPLSKLSSKPRHWWHRHRTRSCS
jgi:hypothetical protein